MIPSNSRAVDFGRPRFPSLEYNWNAIEAVFPLFVIRMQASLTKRQHIGVVSIARGLVSF